MQRISNPTYSRRDCMLRGALATNPKDTCVTKYALRSSSRPITRVLHVDYFSKCPSSTLSCGRAFDSCKRVAAEFDWMQRKGTAAGSLRTALNIGGQRSRLRGRKVPTRILQTLLVICVTKRKDRQSTAWCARGKYVDTDALVGCIIS